MFRAMFSPIIRSTWLYFRYLAVFTQVVVGWCPLGTPAGNNLGEHRQILKRQSSVPDDGRKHRPKRIEPTWNNKLIYIMHLKRLRWSRGSVLDFGTQVRGFTPGWSRRIFRAKKNPQNAFLRRGSRSFTACKRTLNVTWKSAFRQNSLTFLAHSSTFRRWVLSRGDTRGDDWWRKLERLTQIAQ